MDLGQVLKILESGPASTLFICAIWLVRELIGLKRKKETEIEKKIEALSESLTKNTIVATRLEVKLDHVEEKLNDFPKMQKDLNELHKKVRELSNAAAK